MKKLSIIIVIAIVLITANILFSDNSSKIKKRTPSLAEVINMSGSIISFEIKNKDKKLKLLDKFYLAYEKNSCFGIESINYYCADNKKISLLEKFLNSNIKDSYENNAQNLERLGFDPKGNTFTLIITTSSDSDISTTNKKTLFFGNINDFNEVYVLQGSRIYKIDFFKGLLEVNTKYWIDRSKPIISFVDTDEFDVQVKLVTSNKSFSCASLKHKDLVLKPEYSSLRNTFFDLYATDVVKIVGSNKNHEDEILVSLINSNTNKKYFIRIWKENFLVYLALDSAAPNVFIIPNSVYDNVKSYCNK
jgi:hypothetical protein